MKIKVKKSDLPDPTRFVRRAGYGLIFDRRRGIQSFVKRFSADLYPRFHLYVEDESDSWSLNLHLDQKAAIYKGVTAHSGEYDGPVVEKEIGRIKELIK